MREALERHFDPDDDLIPYHDLGNAVGLLRALAWHDHPASGESQPD